ncbi:MAG: chain-length determining protein [Bacteroidaceae bacterium]|nr:chain-length determining protein [Bacteroidaceae bacterium]
MEGENEKKQLLKEADLLQLVGKLLSKWKFIMKVCIVFFVFGVVMAFSTIKEYTSEIVVAPESTGSSVGASIGSLAAIVGIDMSSMAGGDAIYPILYPDIIQSLPFLSSLFDVRVQSLDGTIDTTYYHYKSKLQKKSWVDHVKALPKKAMKWAKNLFSPKNGFGGDPAQFDPYRLSETQMAMIEKLKNSISIFVDKKTEVITLSYTDQDPLIAATMTDTIMNRLQQRITEYRTKKAMDDCVYIEKLYKEAKAEYEKAQEEYAMYVDRNRNVTQERFLIEKERLEADKDLKNTLYTQWAQQFMIAQAKVQEYTPAFTTLKPAVVPALPSTMRKLMIMFIYTVLGGVVSVAYILLKEPVISIWKKLFKSEL